MSFSFWKLSLLAFWLALLVGACKNEEQSIADLSGFEEFYERFHRDSLYQIEHIIFPLAGLPTDADSTTIHRESFKWQKNDWIMHRSFNQNNSEFVIERIPVNDGLIIERLIHRTGSFGLTRRFAKIGGEWYLIYYAGLNRINSNPS